MDKNITIEKIIEGCRKGDSKMQELLYRQNASKMLAISMRYARDRMEAEDILQNGFIRIFQKLDNYRNEGSFEGWMKRIVVNTAIESYRKNQRTLNAVDIDEVHELAVGQLDHGRLAMKDLMSLIQQLADGYRMVFNMYVIEGYSHQEIAETLGISESTSKSQLSRARSILQKEILKMEEIKDVKYVG